MLRPRLELPAGGLILPPMPPLAAGLRLSTDCPSRRFIEEYEPDRYAPFNEGVAMMGHLLASVWIEQEAPHSVVREFPIPWAWGVSHIDAVIPDGHLRGCWEIKTSGEPDPKPTEANRRQVKRMIRAAERASIDIPDPFRIVVIGKSGKSSAVVNGPWTVKLSDDDRAWIDAEFDLLDSWQSRYPAIDTFGDEFQRACVCGSCIPIPAEALQGQIRSVLDEQFHPAKLEYDFWKQEKQAAREAVESLAAGLQEGKYESDHYKLTVKADKRIAVRVKNTVMLRG